MSVRLLRRPSRRRPLPARPSLRPVPSDVRPVVGVAGPLGLHDWPLNDSAFVQLSHTVPFPAAPVHLEDCAAAAPTDLEDG